MAIKRDFKNFDENKLIKGTEELDLNKKLVNIKVQTNEKYTLASYRWKKGWNNRIGWYNSGRLARPWCLERLLLLPWKLRSLLSGSPQILCSSKCHKYNDYNKVPYIVLSYPYSLKQTSLQGYSLAPRPN